MKPVFAFTSRALHIINSRIHNRCYGLLSRVISTYFYELYVFVQKYHKLHG